MTTDVFRVRGVKSSYIEKNIVRKDHMWTVSTQVGM